METDKPIPGTISIPDTPQGWASLYRSVSSMRLETCEKILDANKVPHNAMVVLDYRKEVCNLCLRKGVPRLTW